MLKFCEKLFVVAMLFYTTGAVLPFLAGSQSRYGRMEGNPFELALQLAFYAVAFWFMALHWRTVIHGALHAKWLILLLMIAIASTAWSQDPFFTLRRSIVLVATTAFGIYFGSRFTVPQQLRLLACSCALVVLASFAIALLVPRYGIDHTLHSGDWQGAFTQKNMLARMMVLAAMVFYFVRPTVARSSRWLGLAGALILLMLSRSVTGAIVFAALCCTVPLYNLLRAKVTFSIPVAIALGLAASLGALLVVSSLTDVLQFFHRSARLTGRTELWDAVVISIMKHPWLGYGFNAFWQGMTGESASVLLTVRWPALHSHNGFLDLTLDLGLLGLATFAIGYLALARRALDLVRRVRGPVPAWLCTYLAFMFFYNFSESSILVANNICWVMYTASAVSLFAYFPKKSIAAEIAPPTVAPAELMPVEALPEHGH